MANNPSSTEQAHGTLSTFWHPILALDADQSQQHTSKENEVKNAKAADRRQRAQYRTILKNSVSRKQTNYPLTLGYWGSLNCVPDTSQLPVSTRRAPKPARRVHFVDQTEVEPHAPFFPHHQHVSQEQGYEAGITGIREQAQTPSKYEVIPSFEYSYEPVQGPIDEERDPSPSDEQILDPNIDPTLDSIVFPWQLYTNGKAG
ncbi:hypothetical protein SLS60_003989 [Paraconiothyrium brasiliense]|uniref:Uncharacterized protein n=1 Tax=Paraconiothyrium brasiliense TaxID=300254 RepID=A0ABR3RR30_9PLEO